MSAIENLERDVTSRPANVLHHWSRGLVVVGSAWAVSAIFAYFAWTPGFTLSGTIMGLMSLVATIFGCVMFDGFTTIRPYERLVISLFGTYVGVESREGLSWMWQWYSVERVSTALCNFETQTTKVNDHSGNPIIISAVVVYKIVDPAKSVYVVEDAEEYVEQQVLTGMRSLAAEHDYDDIAPRSALAGTDAEDLTKVTPLTLRGNVDEIADKLKDSVQKRLGDVGVEIVEARIVHLSYSPEIAAAMLKRQQATAIIAARETIVEGAVGIVNQAMEQMKAKGFALDEDRRATIAGNLLVVLAGDREASPVMPLGLA